MIMPSDECLTDNKSTLVQVMAWCRQATSHYLSQCWLSSFLPYGVTRPQWVKTSSWSWWLHFTDLSKLSNFFISHWTNFLVIRGIFVVLYCMHECMQEFLYFRHWFIILLKKKLCILSIRKCIQHKLKLKEKLVLDIFWLGGSGLGFFSDTFRTHLWTGHWLVP